MCGICGIYNADGAPAQPELLNSMLAAMDHRGPDDRGTTFDSDAAIGMCRLSIIDPVGGQQPLTNEDHTVLLVANGEIYNYRELTHRLQQQGHRFTTASDCEVIVHLYEELGEDCVHELRGMFGFAIWDARKRKLFVARDRLGIKPLYYAETEQGLVFGSEIKAILQHPGARAELDFESLSHYLSLKYVPAPRTMFRGIQALPPGHTLTRDPRGTVIRRYWNLSFERSETTLSEDQYAEQLEALLREVVQMHLVSDVPFGAFLSGGVDSSTIVALMSQFMTEPVKTFSVGFTGEGSEYSELPFARMVAEHYHTDHHEVMIGPRDFIDLSEKVVRHLDQPIADEACLGNFMLAELASQHVKMVLTGEGGDELFAGYARYSGERLSPLFGRLPSAARSLTRSAADSLPGLRRPRLALNALCQTDESVRFAEWFPLFNLEQKASLAAGRLGDIVRQYPTPNIVAAELSDSDARDTLSRMLYLDTKLWLPDDLLARGDKTSMAASVEARVPLLDHKLVEWAAMLPPNLKLRGLTRKYLLKKVGQKWLPPAIINRKKQGFPMPFSLWFRGEARAYVHDLLGPDLVKRRGLFDPKYVERLLQQHDAGVADHGPLIWGLLSVELWHRQFIDRVDLSLKPAGDRETYEITI